MKTLNAVGKRVLFISDLHMPYHHPDSFKFLRAIKKKYLDKKDLIVNLGDEVDGHQISFHQSETSSEILSASEELQACIDLIHMKGGLHETFPEMYLCESNHGSLIFRRAKAHGLPISYFKTYQQVYETPKWKWEEDFLIKTKLGNIYVCHGKSGMYGKLSSTMGCSAVQGHFHGKFEITWHRSALMEQFNMLCGCLIDRQRMAFAYGKNHLPKPILGVGLVSREGYPTLLKMQLNSKNQWIGKLP